MTKPNDSANQGGDGAAVKITGAMIDAGRRSLILHAPDAEEIMSFDASAKMLSAIYSAMFEMSF